MTPDRVVRAQELFSRAEFEEIPGAGHIVHLDQPERFHATLKDFLELHGSESN